jgi:hypothetical protein
VYKQSIVCSACREDFDLYVFRTSEEMEQFRGDAASISAA